MATVSIIAARKGYPKGDFPGFRALGMAAITALPGLMTAVIIVVGILGGVFTPTESAAIATIYTLIIGLVVYRTLGMRQFKAAVINSAKTTSMIMLIIGSAAAFGWLLALLEAPQMMSDLILGATDSPFLILAMVLVCLLILGTFMDMAPLIIIVTPIFLPVVQAIGVDPVHFGIIMMLALGIGTITPPVGDGSVRRVGCWQNPCRGNRQKHVAFLCGAALMPVDDCLYPSDLFITGELMIGIKSKIVRCGSAYSDTRQTPQIL